MKAPLALTAALLEGREQDQATVERVFRGLRTWLLAEGTLSLPRCLGLPTTPAKLRQALRDVHLARAAALLDGSTWQQAKQLAALIERFELYRWPRWLGRAHPPEDADPVEIELWRAMKAAGGCLPGTAQALHQVITKQIKRET